MVKFVCVYSTITACALFVIRRLQEITVAIFLVAPRRYSYYSIVYFTLTSVAFSVAKDDQDYSC